MNEPRYIDLYTVKEIKAAKRVLEKIRPEKVNQVLMDEVVTEEVMARINRMTGQENNRRYMTYRLEYVASQVHPSRLD